MASVDWQKIHTAGEAKAIFKHDDKECRLVDNHSNEHINKVLTECNLQTNDYETVCKNYNNRIEYLDSQPKANKRKDRVTDYVDSQTKQHRTSMRHIHTYFILEVNGKLNCNAISTKKNMIKLHNDIDKIAQEHFGVQFLTGEKSKSKDSVESLKLKSKSLELEQREKDIEGREEAVAYDEVELEARKKLLDEREVALSKREQETDVVYRSASQRQIQSSQKLSRESKR